MCKDWKKKLSRQNPKLFSWRSWINRKSCWGKDGAWRHSEEQRTRGRGDLKTGYRGHKAEGETCWIRLDGFKIRAEIYFLHLWALEGNPQGALSWIKVPKRKEFRFHRNHGIETILKLEFYLTLSLSCPSWMSLPLRTQIQNWHFLGETSRRNKRVVKTC